MATETTCAANNYSNFNNKFSRGSFTLYMLEVNVTRRISGQNYYFILVRILSVSRWKINKIIFTECPERVYGNHTHHLWMEWSEILSWKMSFLSKLPYIIATILLLIGGALFFAFPLVWDCMRNLSFPPLSLSFSIRNIFEYYIRYEPNRIYLIIPVLAGSYLIPMYLFVMSTFFLASFVDPGIYPRGEYPILIESWVFCG